MNDSPISLCDGETYDRLELVEKGQATTEGGLPAGLLVFRFNAGNSVRRVVFVHVSSVMYFDDIYSSESVYPYAYVRGIEDGLYECFGSSYVSRIRKDSHFTGEVFLRHRHFVYFDSYFYWNIVAESIVVEAIKIES